MKAVFVLFDTLARRFLPPYGAEGVYAPNFERLAARATTFDNCYAGSMPCMPARREMHTGRYNFLHRSWGPLEPFDDSVPEMLKRAGVYTHLITDHFHYWEDGGATYHTRFSSHEFMRGQQGDPWKARLGVVDIPENINAPRPGARQDWINREYMAEEADHSQTGVFDAAVEFLQTNHTEDGWLLQAECFDPHEPFFTYDAYRRHYADAYTGPVFDWPDYKMVDESPAAIEHVRYEYLALVSMCDHSLGRILDAMDAHDMWDDTLLIVGTDHGFLLGEHNWLGKGIQPWWDENIHTPLFVWDPRHRAPGERRDALVQTIDFGPTLLDFFGVEPTSDMQGRPLAATVASDTPVHDGGLFGAFGGHVSVTDGRYVYMRACASPSNTPLDEYTLMPTHMRSLFTPDELAEVELAGPLPFTKGTKVLKLPGRSMGAAWAFGTLLYDLQSDPGQTSPLRDDALELRMAQLLVEEMRRGDAPDSQFKRLGLPAEGPVRVEHLLIEKQWAQVEAGRAPRPEASDFRTDGLCVNSPLADLLADERTRPLVQSAFGIFASPELGAVGKSPVQLALYSPAFNAAMLHHLDDALAEATGACPS